ncbi:hypothetical protein IAG41_05225 [Sphingomonas sp. JC676]|uniref:hypothetical protein n=1 Tax=Sphingomonas sp. JC676 TaxID=2768065 RepID=UPI001657AFCB|nr:hypothetical protein [Sphingomonas sp. JC676]MBC9031787.1 hypothetical protein [Sphingomonas sp. JC676]
MTQPAPADDPDTGRRQVEGFIDRFSPEIADRVRACRAALRRRLPTANELVYDNYNALAIGYAPAERTSDAVVSLAIYPRGILLYFIRGASLPDPDGLLKGAGSRGRHVPMPGPETLDDPGVAALLASALAEAPRPMPESGAGRTIVKSISAKQRPRRPATQEPA